MTYKCSACEMPESKTEKAHKELEVSNPNAFKKRYGANLKLFNDMLGYIGYMPRNSAIIEAIALAKTYHELEEKKLPYSFFKSHVSTWLLRKWGAMFHSYLKLYEQKNVRVINHLVGYGVGWAFVKKDSPQPKTSAKNIRKRVKQSKLNSDIGKRSIAFESLSQMINAKAIKK